MSGPVIKVEELSKSFTISREGNRHVRYTALRDVVSEKISSIFSTKVQHEEEFWALREISFEISKGDRVGVIGRNGAGKSTLLKILSRITEPTSGRIGIKGRLASLLEVGTGFHPELTGRENIYLNGAILGMSRSEVRSKFDDIVQFAETERFLDTPVKRYSSGMYVRLAFSVAAHLEPEILIVDEVLAVGDAMFQKKCLGKMEEVSKNDGRTILFVSHNMAAIENLCSRAFVLDGGKLTFAGEVSGAIARYQQDQLGSRSGKWMREQKEGKSSIVAVEAALQGIQPELELQIDFAFVSGPHHKKLFVAIDISNSMGVTVLQAIPELEPFIEFTKLHQNFRMLIKLPALIPDQYTVSVWLGPHFSETLVWERNVVGFEITESPSKGRSFPHSSSNGFMVPSSKLVNR